MPKLKPCRPLFSILASKSRILRLKWRRMKKLLLSLLSVGALVGNASAMGPLGSSMIKHDRQGDRRTIVIPAADQAHKSAVLGPIHPCRVAVLGPIHPCRLA